MGHGCVFIDCKLNPTPFPYLSIAGSPFESQQSRKGSSSGSVLQGGAHTAENKPQKRDLIKEAAMDLIPNFSMETWMLLATSLVLLYL